MKRSAARLAYLATALFVGSTVGCSDRLIAPPLCHGQETRCGPGGVERCQDGKWQPGPSCATDEQCLNGDCVFEGPVRVVECGNGTLNDGEHCDGDNLAGGTCADYGYAGGKLHCANDCTHDLSGCESTPVNVCGDDVREGTEECDGDDFNGEDCVSFGFLSGALRCDTDCKLDASACVQVVPPTCGDGQRNGNEVCEGTDLGGQSCTSFQYVSGDLTCLPDCTFDESKCVSAPSSTGLLTLFDGADVQVNASVVTPYGHTYVVGTYSASSVTMGGATLVGDPASPVHGFVAKLNAAGTMVWAENIAGVPVDVINQPQKGVYVLTSWGTVIKVFRVFPNGAFATLKANLKGDLSVSAGRLVADANYIYVAGTISSGKLKFAGKTVTATVSDEIFVAAVSHSFTVVPWITLTSAQGDVRGLAVEALSQTMALLANVKGDVVNGTPITSCTSVGGQDLLIARLDIKAGQTPGNGMLKYLKCFGSTGDDIARHLAVSDNGQVYVAGYLAGQPVASGLTLPLTGFSDFIARYDTTTKQIAWSKDMMIYADRIVTSGSGSVYVAGQNYSKSLLTVREFSEADGTKISGRGLVLSGPTRHARVTSLASPNTGQTVVVGNFNGELTGQTTTLQVGKNTGFLWRE